MPNWIEKTFIDPQTRIEIAIHFPQGARSIKSKGDGAGKSYRVDVYFQVQFRYQDAPQTEASWFSVPGIIVGGIYKDGFTIRQEYYGSSTIVSPPTLANSYNINKAFSVRIRRLTRQMTPEQEQEDPEYRFYYTSVLQSITGYQTNTTPTIDPKNTTIAKTALSIKATKQLNGQIEGINALVQTYCYNWIPTGTAPTYINGNWTKQETNNPASLFRYVLTHPANPQQIKDLEISTRLDLEKIQYWHQYCANHVPPLKFNSVITNTRSILEVLRDICAAGRASPALIDGKWSVNIDEPKSIVQHFSPHNSWGFESSKGLPKVPDGLKIKFYNENLNFREDELIVYNYGKTSANSELFESINLPGVTDPLLVEDHGKWHFAQIKLRPEIYTLNTDVEYLVCNRGDLVKVTHDVPMWGLGSGRVKNRLKNTTVLTNNATTASCFELDEPVYIDSNVSKAYTMRTRSVTGASTATTLQKTFNLISYSYVGTTVTITVSVDHPIQVGDTIIVSSPISTINTTATVTSVNLGVIKYIKTGLTGSQTTTALASGTITRASGYYTFIKLASELTYSLTAPGDLFLYGELNQESQDLIILSIEPTGGAKNARLTMVDYGVTDTYNIFTDYKDLSTATFETQITNVNPGLVNSLQNYKPQITMSKVVSDYRAMQVISPGVYRGGILIPFTNPEGLPDSAQFVEADYVKNTSSHYISTLVPAVPTTNGSVSIRDVIKGATYMIRLRYVTQNGVVGMWTDPIFHTVTGKGIGPENVTGFSYSRKEVGIELQWDLCLSPDYRSTIIKRVDSTLLVAADKGWSNPLAETLFEGTSNIWSFVQPPDGTYNFLIKHTDVGKNESLIPQLLTVEYDGITIATVQAELSNDNHQIPTDSDGANANLLYTGTNIYVYHGGSLLKYDTVGTANATWKINTVTGTGAVAGDLAPLTDPLGDDYAILGDLVSLGTTSDFATVDISISGKDKSGIAFTIIKQQNLIKQKNGENLVLYRINSTTPVVYKNSPDKTTAGDFSKIIVQGKRYEGTSAGELYGWLGITPYNGAVAGSEEFVYQSIDRTPLTSDQSTKWVIKHYGIDPLSVTNPPARTAGVLDTEEINVVFEGEVYTLEIESTNGNIFRPGYNGTTTLIARVFKNGLEVTAEVPAAQFKWRRISGIPRVAPNDDATWNTTYATGSKQITLNVDDVYARATFFCEIVTT